MTKDMKFTFEENIVHLMEEGFPVMVILDTRSGNPEVSVVSGFIKCCYADFIHVVRDPTTEEVRNYGSSLVGIDVPKSRIVSITSYARRE